MSVATGPVVVSPKCCAGAAHPLSLGTPTHNVKHHSIRSESDRIGLVLDIWCAVCRGSSSSSPYLVVSSVSHSSYEHVLCVAFAMLLL